MSENNYSKYIKSNWWISKEVNDVWFKASKCNSYSSKNDCNNDISCFYNEGNKDKDEEPECNEKTYSAGFTYNYNKKTYFFKGNNVVLYDDAKRKVADGYPKKIEEVFKGIPGNIDAAFSWGKDGKTYFLKDQYIASTMIVKMKLNRDILREVN